MNTEFPYTFNQHPDIAGLIGAIAATWAGIEFQLSHVFTWMMGCSPLHGSAAYYQINNSKARVDMMRGLLQYLHSDAERASVNEIFDLVSKSAKIRNRHLHSPYIREGNDVFQLTNIGSRYPHGFKKPVDQKALWEDAAEMALASQKVGAIISQITRDRPLLLRRETVSESLQQKFRELFGYEIATDHQKTNDEQPSPPPRSSRA